MWSAEPEIICWDTNFYVHGGGGSQAELPMREIALYEVLRVDAGTICSLSEIR